MDETNFVEAAVPFDHAPSSWSGMASRCSCVRDRARKVRTAPRRSSGADEPDPKGDARHNHRQIRFIID